MPRVRRNPQEKAVVSEYRRNIADPDEGWTRDGRPGWGGKEIGGRAGDDEAKDDFISAP